MVPRKGKKVEVWVPSITWSHQTLRTPPAALGQSGESDEEGEERGVGSLGLGQGQDLEIVTTGSGETATALLGPRVF